MGARTALGNERRGLLAAYGIVWPPGVNTFRTALTEKLEVEQAKLTPLSQELFSKLCEEFKKVETEVVYYDEKLQAMAITPPESQRLVTIPGIGPITATALIAAGGDMDNRVRLLAERLFDVADEVRVVGADTDVTFSLQGRKGKVSAADANMPSGEVFYSPVEDSASGVVTFSANVNGE